MARKKGQRDQLKGFDVSVDCDTVGKNRNPLDFQKFLRKKNITCILHNIQTPAMLHL